MKLIVLDLEGSGLKLKPDYVFRSDSFEDRPHQPGYDADCILEVGLVVLDGETLKEEHRFSTGVLPPGVETEEQFDRWATMLREKNAFVHEMHTKSGLLAALVKEAADGTLPSYQHVEGVLVDIAAKHSERLKVEGAGPMHAGNSDLMLTGNSIANLDIPMLRLWMPAFHNMLSYRIMDVSVLRTFYTDLSKVTLPDGLAERIKSGTGRAGSSTEHRALADAENCAEALREAVKYARDVANGDTLAPVAP